MDLLRTLDVIYEWGKIPEDVYRDMRAKSEAKLKEIRV